MSIHTQGRYVCVESDIHFRSNGNFTIACLHTCESICTYYVCMLIVHKILWISLSESSAAAHFVRFSHWIIYVTDILCTYTM